LQGRVLVVVQGVVLGNAPYWLIVLKDALVCGAYVGDAVAQ
jgi:hypothetical protein